MTKNSSLEKPKKQMQALYGENKTVTGSFNIADEVICSNGAFLGKRNGNILSFKGIPFAEAPVGERRWKPPVPAKDQSANIIRQAFYFGPAPIQTELFSEMGSLYPQSEDCLYLNIWINAADKTKEKPVMVFFHGGSYGWGATSDPIYEGTNFVSEQSDIILVTAEYRTGMLGFMDFSKVPGGEEFKEAGNLGLLDQVEALRWVQKNIKAFGGDPDNVTIFGESAGGGSVSILPVMPCTKGLFKRAIAESGSIALTSSKEQCLNLTKRLLKETGLKSMDQLMALSEEEIVKHNLKLNEYNNFPERDGIVVPEDLYECYRRGDAADIDIISGTNQDESRYWINEMGGLFMYAFCLPILHETNIYAMEKADRDRLHEYMFRRKGKFVWRRTEFYTDLLFRVPATVQTELHGKSGGRAYLYLWNQPSALRFLKCCHAVELSYVFNNPQCTIYTGNNYDDRIGKLTRRLWTEFARKGDPSLEDCRWPQYEGVKRECLLLGPDTHVEEDIGREDRLLLEPMMKYGFNGYYADLNFNVPYIYCKILEILFVLGVAAGIIILLINIL